MVERKNVKWLIVLASLLLSGVAQAQVNDAIELTRAVLQTERQAIVTATLGLSDSESKVFWPLYRTYRAELAVIGDRRVELIHQYADNWEDMSDSVAEAMLDDMLGMESDTLKLKKKYFKQFGKVLSPTTVARYYQIESRMDTVVDLELSAEIPLIR